MKNVLKVSIVSIILFVLLSFPVFARTGKVVNTDEVRFREQASATEDSTVLGMVEEGTLVEIIGEVTGWYKVEYDGQVGYINASYLEEVDEEINTDSENIEQIKQPENDTQVDESFLQDEQIENSVIVYKLNKSASVKIMPLMNSSTLTTLNKDTVCEIVQTAGKWTYIKAGSIEGWVVSSRISETTINNATINSNVTETTTIYETSKKAYVNLDSINVRRQPTTAAELVAKLTLNTEVLILGEDGDWYLVELNGEKVYISKELLSDKKVTTTSRNSDYDRSEVANIATSENVLAESTSNNIINTQNVQSSVTGKDIVEYAKQFLGYPYVYGTAGPSSFDCSGFTNYVYKHFGYNISRSSKTQQNDGTYVAKENLQLGDIIIFLNTDLTAVGHVGIYIGNNQFIHASSSKTGVIISDLTTESYIKRYHSARRIL